MSSWVKLVPPSASVALGPPLPSHPESSDDSDSDSTDEPPVLARAKSRVTLRSRSRRASTCRGVGLHYMGFNIFEILFQGWWGYCSWVGHSSSGRSRLLRSSDSNVVVILVVVVVVVSSTTS